MNDLLKLFETIRRKKLLGTLVIGRGKNSFEVFFEDDFLYVSRPEFLPKIDLNGLVETGLLGKKLDPATVENLVVEAELSRTTLPELIRSRNLVNDAEFQELIRLHLQEEIFERLLDNNNTFHFQDGHVPDALIGQSGISTSFPTAMEPMIEMVRKRLEQLQHTRQLVPSSEEVFVITEKGMAKKQSGSLDFGPGRIVDLLDGFRTLQSIIEDCFFFRFYVERQVVDLLMGGWIRKTIVPEIQGVNLNSLSRDEAREYVVYYKNAIKYGTDELRAREGYAALAERLGKNEEAVVQYNFIGDTLCKMGRTGLAVRAYRRGLALDKDNTVLTEKIIRIYGENAEDAIGRKQVKEAMALYRKALQLCPDNRDVLRSLLDLHISQRNVNEVSELCDQAASASREKGDPESAIAILKHVMAIFQNKPLFRKKLVNFYLDLNMTREATDEMEALARQYLENGETTQGADLVDKILRIDPTRKELRKLCRNVGRVRTHRRKRTGRRFLSTSCLLAILVMTLYQLWAHIEFQHVSHQKYLAYDNPIVRAEDVDIVETPREVKLRKLSRAAAQYRRRFRFSVFDWEAEKLQEDYLGAAAQIERFRNQEKQRLIDGGRLLFRQGEDALAVSTLERLQALSEGDPWRRQADAEIAKHRSFEDRARAVRKAADRATEQGNLEEAHHCITQLVTEFAASKAARGVKYPIELLLVPPELSRGLHDVPQVLKLSRKESRSFNLRVPGHEELRADIRPAGGPRQVLFFNQKPLWTVTLGPPAHSAVTVSSDRVYYVNKTGDLHAVDLASGTLRWTFATSALVVPSSAAFLGDRHLHLPLNNGRILSFGLDGDGRPDTTLKVDGFIQTELVSSSDGTRILFGTSRKTLVSWDPTTGEIKSIAVPETPGALATCGRDDVLVLGRSGAVYRIDTARKRVVWKSRLRQRFVEGPMLAGSPESGTAVLEGEFGEIVAFDVASGNIQWRRNRSPGKRVTALLRGPGRILICEQDALTVEIDPQTNAEITVSKSSLLLRPFEGIVELPTGLGFLCTDGSFVIADPDTLRPKWRYHREGSTIRSAASNGRYLVLVDTRGNVSAFLYPPE